MAVKAHVTDHAILRYAERRYNLPMDRLRQEIEAKALPAATVGATFFQFEDVKFALSPPDDGGTVRVKTVLGRHMHPTTKHIKKNRSEIDL